MILCVCNNIREQDIKKQPELAALIGSCCGKCLVDKSCTNPTKYEQDKIVNTCTINQ